MTRPSLLLSAGLLALLCSCGRPDTVAPPCPADGRFVALYIEDDPDEKAESVEGKLVEWSDGWASLQKDGLTIHVPVARIRVVHESSK